MSQRPQFPNCVLYYWGQRPFVGEDTTFGAVFLVKVRKRLTYNQQQHFSDLDLKACRCQINNQVRLFQLSDLFIALFSLPKMYLMLLSWHYQS